MKSLETSGVFETASVTLAVVMWKKAFWKFSHTILVKSQICHGKYLLQFYFTQRSREQMQVLKENPLLILISAQRSRFQLKSLKLSFLLGVFFWWELLFEDCLLHNNLTWLLEVKENSSLSFGKRCQQLCVSRHLNQAHFPKQLFRKSSDKNSCKKSCSPSA